MITFICTVYLVLVLFKQVKHKLSMIKSKIFLVFISTYFFLPIESISQINIYHPFPDSNVVWRETRYATDGGFGYYQWDEERFIKGDTVIGLYTYHKIYESGLFAHYYVSPNILDTSYYYYNDLVTFIREDNNKKVYVYFNNDELIYDFNLQLGDTIPNGIIHNTTDTIIISEIDSIFDGMNFRKRFNLSSTSASSFLNASIIEGIGTTIGLFSDLEAGAFEMNNELHCFIQNDSVKYTDSSMYACDIIDNTNAIDLNESISIFPNPFNEYTTITFSKPMSGRSAQMKLYNSLGLLVRTENIDQETHYKLYRNELADGIYFYQVTGVKFSMVGKIILTKNYR